MKHEFLENEIRTEAERLHARMKRLDYSLTECMLFAPFTLKINSLKKQKNAIILATLKRVACKAYD